MTRRRPRVAAGCNRPAAPVHAGERLKADDGVVTAHRPILALLALALCLPGCARSLLYVGGSDGIAAPGEIPRDSRGEPVWSAIRPTPPGWTRADSSKPAPPQGGSQP